MRQLYVMILPVLKVDDFTELVEGTEEEIALLQFDLGTIVVQERPDVSHLFHECLPALQNYQYKVKVHHSDLPLYHRQYNVICTLKCARHLLSIQTA